MAAAAAANGATEIEPKQKPAPDPEHSMWARWASNPRILATQDDKQSNADLRKAVEGGNYLLQCVVAQRFLRNKKPEQAFEQFLAAAKAGSHIAANNVGAMLELGFGTAQSDKKALEWYQRSMLRGCTRAQHRLGYLLAVECVPHPSLGPKQGLKYLRKAAEGKDADSAFDYAMTFVHGAGDTVHDLTSAIEWLQRAIDFGSVGAAFELAGIHMHAPNIDKDTEGLVSRLMMYAAEKGHALAQDMLGQFYSTGSGVPRDFNTARFWYEKAAESGVVTAKRDLALMLEQEAISIAKAGDKKKAKVRGQEAVELYIVGDRNGDFVSTYRLAMCYEHKVGNLHRRLRTVKKLLRKASNGGCLPAMRELLKRGYATSDEAKILCAKIAAMAANTKHPDHAHAHRVLVEMGLVETCGGCNQSKFQVPGLKLMKCAQCKMVSFCSAACQEVAWKGGHREECNKFAREKDGGAETKDEAEAGAETKDNDEAGAETKDEAEAGTETKDEAVVWKEKDVRIIGDIKKYGPTDINAAAAAPAKKVCELVDPGDLHLFNFLLDPKKNFEDGPPDSDGEETEDDGETGAESNDDDEAGAETKGEKESSEGKET